MFRAGWVVGSLDLIGSPAGFTRTVGGGLKDFVALPYRGLLNGPWAFIGGVTNGSTSLVKHVSAGTLTSVTNFASSVSRNLDRLSLDSEHCQRNELSRREVPEGFGQGLVNGLSGVGVSLLGAVGGIAHHPITAVMEQGMSPTGIVAGLTRGFVGAVTKPLGGAAEFVAQTGQGLLHGTGWSVQRRQKRPSRPLKAPEFESSELKYSWKMLEDAKVLAFAEVTTLTRTSMTLLLTPDVIVVIADEEDAQDAVHELTDIECSACEDDPTMMTLTLDCSDEDVNTTKRYVAQFVMDTAGAVQCTVSDFEPDDSDDSDSDVKKKQKLKKKKPIEENDVVVFGSPISISAFVDAFQLAKRQLRRKGFDLLL